MTTTNSKPRFPAFRLSLFALTAAFALPACYDPEAPNSDTDATTDGDGAGASGGSPSEKAAAGSGSSGAAPREEGGSGGVAGAEDPIGSEGGTTARGGNSAAGGRDVETSGGMTTLDPTGGASDTSEGGSFGEAGNDGQGEGGAGGDPPEELESLCFDQAGEVLPYDYSVGLMSEFAFELSMSCDVGGFLLPLALADPIELSEVNAYVMQATDWYRAHILNCADATSTLSADAYGLLPASQSAELSNADFDVTLALFFNVLARHDLQPDAVSAENKEKIDARIKSVRERAVTNVTETLTKTLSEPDCIPAIPLDI